VASDLEMWSFASGLTPEADASSVSKRPAHEGPNTAPDAKRVKDSHDVLTEPDVKTPAVRRVWVLREPDASRRGFSRSPLERIATLTFPSALNAGECELEDWFHPFKFTLTSIQRRWKSESRYPFQRRARETSDASSAQF
jgi:hypothetical protein